MHGQQIEFDLCPTLDIVLEGITIDTGPTGVWDVLQVLPSDWPPLDGVLSLLAFQDHAVTLDLASGVLTVGPSGTSPGDEGAWAQLEARRATGHDGSQLTVVLKVEMDAVSGWFLLDSGNLASIQLAPHLWRATGRSTDQTSDSARVAAVGLPPMILPIERAAIIYDGVLSEAFVRKHVLLLDLPAERAWARSAKSRRDVAR